MSVGRIVFSPALPSSGMTHYSAAASQGVGYRLTDSLSGFVTHHYTPDNHVTAAHSLLYLAAAQQNRPLHHKSHGDECGADADRGAGGKNFPHAVLVNNRHNDLPQWIGRFRRSCAAFVKAWRDP